jgi:hypothetical protein
MLSWLELSNQHVISCNVSFLKPPGAFCCIFVVSYALISYSAGICLDPVDEARQVSERVAALERVSSDTNTFWIDPQRRCAIVLLQDRVWHVGEFVDGCQKSLTTIYLLVRSLDYQLGTPRGRYDEHNSKFSVSKKPRFNRPVGERNHF